MLAVHGVANGAVAGAAAQITLERGCQIASLPLIEGSGSHDHPGGTEAALKSLRSKKGALHRM
jgi:hypothetical protein